MDYSSHTSFDPDFFAVSSVDGGIKVCGRKMLKSFTNEADKLLSKGAGGGHARGFTFHRKGIVTLRFLI
ncbi:hypothetical protein C5167_037931 [Papaver somniferum]|uniref:Uncharacterized protein n=1 Tax=Papaver somniferum TaxID=3469 RepID=A0A4Y7IAB5_PAPSO|nr:hypothetical protein C5167_037931 [Papaver somniferum]